MHTPSKALRYPRQPVVVPLKAGAAVVVAAAALAACGTIRGGAEHNDALTVVTFNIHAGKDAGGVHNLQRVAASVQREGADVVLLQEVDRGTTRSGGEDQIARLGELTGLHHAFGKTLDYQGGEYGIALLSRPAMTGARVHPLPIDPPQPRAGGSYEPRGALYAAIVVGRDTVHVFNTHLDASRDDGNRRQEAARLLALAAPLLERHALVMIGGDLNSLPDSRVVAQLTEGVFRDAWLECGRGDGFSYPDSLPVRRIDYLLLSPGLRCERATVIDGGPSDHRGVRFAVRLAPGYSRPASAAPASPPSSPRQ